MSIFHGDDSAALRIIAGQNSATAKAFIDNYPGVLSAPANGSVGVFVADGLGLSAGFSVSVGFSVSAAFSLSVGFSASGLGGGDPLSVVTCSANRPGAG